MKAQYVNERNEYTNLAQIAEECLVIAIFFSLSFEYDGTIL